MQFLYISMFVKKKPKRIHINSIIIYICSLNNLCKLNIYNINMRIWNNKKKTHDNYDPYDINFKYFNKIIIAITETFVTFKI